MQDRSKRQILSLIVCYENAADLLLDLSVVALSTSGALLAHAPVWRGRAVAALSAREIDEGYLFVGPACNLNAKFMSTKGLFEAQRFVELKATSVSGERAYRLSPIPETVWRRWLASSEATGRNALIWRSGGLLAARPEI